MKKANKKSKEKKKQNINKTHRLSVATYLTPRLSLSCKSAIIMNNFIFSPYVLASTRHNYIG